MCSCRLTEQLNALGEAATGGVPGGQEGSSEDMSGLVDGIMHQLLAKDVLYQPIQEIGARYPQWLTDHRYTPPVSGYTSVLPVLLLLVTPLGGGFLSQLLVLTLLRLFLMNIEKSFHVFAFFVFQITFFLNFFCFV